MLNRVVFALDIVILLGPIEFRVALKRPTSTQSLNINRYVEGTLSNTIKLKSLGSHIGFTRVRDNLHALLKVVNLSNYILDLKRAKDVCKNRYYVSGMKLSSKLESVKRKPETRTQFEFNALMAEKIIHKK